MVKKKTTLTIDEDLWLAAKLHAVRKGKRDYQVVEEALRRYLGFDVLDEIWEQADMEPEEAERVAVEEVRKHRAEGAKPSQG